jgi:hypothetical protein
VTAIGHFSTGLLIKGRYPRAPLPLLMLCAAVPDILWAAFNLLRNPSQAPLEVVRVDLPFGYIGDQHLVLQPISHALFSNVVLAFALASLAYVAYRELRVAAAVGFAVVGHWVLDFLVHDADLTLWPASTATAVGPPFVFNAEHPAFGLYTSAPLIGYALQTLLVLFCTAVFLHRYPAAGKSGRLKMWLGMLILCAASAPIFINGAMTKMIGGSSQLVLGAVAEMLVMGLAVAALARWSVGRALDTGPMDKTEAEATLFVHRLLKTAGVACFVIAGVYLLQSMIDAQSAPRIGAMSVLMSLLFVVAGGRFLQKNPSTLWFAAALGFVVGPALRLYTDGGRLGPTLLVLELSLALGASFLIRILLRRNLCL